MAEDQKPATQVKVTTPAPETPQQSLLQTLIAQIGAPTTRQIIALAVVGVVVYKFACNDVVISWDDFKTVLFLIVGYFFGKEVSK